MNIKAEILSTVDTPEGGAGVQLKVVFEDGREATAWHWFTPDGGPPDLAQAPTVVVDPIDPNTGGLTEDLTPEQVWKVALEALADGEAQLESPYGAPDQHAVKLLLYVIALCQMDDFRWRHSELAWPPAQAPPA